MTGVSQLASITSSARASSAAPDCWTVIVGETGCGWNVVASEWIMLCISHPRIIGVTENVCPHCELNVLIVNI